MAARTRIGMGAVVLAAVAAMTASSGACASAPVAQPSADVVDHFKYGSVGTEARVGLPYWIWRVLPTVFEDKLPNRPGQGYKRLGFMSDGASHGRPIGTSYRKDRAPLVGLNCATCHAGSIRHAPGEQRRVVLGMPANQMDLQGYARFLTACAN